MTIRTIGLAFNPTNPAAVALVERTATSCAARGLATWSAPAGEYETLIQRLPTTDVLLVLGGDGTFLRAARAVVAVDVPILGINLGKIGFLSKVEATEVDAVLDQLVAGDVTLEERMVLEGRILSAASGGAGASRTTASFVALNDVVVARGSLVRVCRLDVSIGPSHLATFIADGLVVSSPTGSTGYSFSAGGPILDPTSRNLVVTPIAGYLSAIRSVVVGPTQVVSCRVVDAYEALVSIDGREDHPLSIGDIVTVAAHDRPIRFLEPRDRPPFWDLLRHKVELLPS